MPNQNLYAALIGINQYQNANNLNGCIKDILNFDKLLRGICIQQQDNLNYKPIYLLSPLGSDLNTIEKYKDTENVSFDFIAPTFKNVSETAFDHLAQAGEGDVCVFYYSGHGSYIDAPKIFWESQSTRQNQTLVCSDSRSDTGRDLIDKEIAYLLYKTLKNKNRVHCLVIMDCCHSGSNTRSLASSTAPVKYRQTPSQNKELKFEEYMGYDDNFFSLKNGKLEFPSANYVQLSACRDNEKAQDSPSGGLFSENLLAHLNMGGSKESYRSIARNLAATVSLTNGTQNPVAFPDNKIDEKFLGGKIIPYTPRYEVRYLPGAEIWQLQAGSLQGIVPSSAGKKTTVNISPGNIEAEVSEVQDFTATLTGNTLSALDKDNAAYKATLKQLAIKKQVIGISKTLNNSPKLLKYLLESYDPNRHIYIEIDTSGNEAPAYIVNTFDMVDKDYFYLTQSSNDIPVFKSENDAPSFLNNVDAVGKWVYTKSLANEDSMFTADDFIFTIEVVEGAEKNANSNSLSGKKTKLNPDSQTDLCYKKNEQPAFRFSIEINPASNLRECYVQALYLDSIFGIDPGLIEPNANHLTREGKIKLKYRSKGRDFDLIRLQLDQEYAVYNINEIVERLKIFVSTTANMTLDSFKQDSLELQKDIINAKSRSIAENDGGESKWSVFDFDLRIVGQDKEKELIAGAETGFSSFTIKTPAGFTALATAVTEADTSSLLTRSVEPVAPSIWGSELTDDLAFNDDFGSLSGKGVVAIELSAMKNEALPELKQGDELVITPKTSNLTRSVEQYDSTTIPFGIDKETGLYFPIGYQDEEGKIHITSLPQPTDGNLVPDAVTTRSISGSVKLYFKKLFRKPTNSLTLHFYENDQWNTTTDTGKISGYLQSAKPKQLPLVVHGIFGDTKGMIEGLKGDAGFAKDFPTLLSYDYENLNTPVPDTAKALKDSLTKIGVGEHGIPKLTVIAHSMGGLVMRWLIEKAGGGSLVEKLVMAGTPNSGSEWSKTAHYILNGAGFLLTHALNAAGPLKYAITGIGFLLKKFHNPEVALKDMGFDSNLMKQLEQSSAPDTVPYYLVGSNTSLYREYQGDDRFLSIVKNWLMDKIVFPGLDIGVFKNQPNDMAVTIDSMKKVAGFNAGTNMQVLPGDHISYFSEKETRKAILDLAK